MTSRGFGPASSSACCCSNSVLARFLTTSGACVPAASIESREPGRGDMGALLRGEGDDLSSAMMVRKGVCGGPGVPARERWPGVGAGVTEWERGWCGVWGGAVDWRECDWGAGVVWRDKGVGVGVGVA